MATIKEEAKIVKENLMKNISELEKVSIELDVKEKEFTKDDGKKFTVMYVEIDGEEYRLPVSVLQSLKAIIEKKPKMKYFSVAKEGEGMNTKYIVIPAE